MKNYQTSRRDDAGRFADAAREYPAVREEGAAAPQTRLAVRDV